METQKKRVLLVDDDDEIRSMYEELLQRNGFDVIEAKDGVEGLDIATSDEKIDLIFTGIIMPRMDGFQLIQSLKEYTNTAKIPIIVSSHLGREDDRKKMDELGVRDFIVRGITTPVDIVKRVLQAINQGEYNLALKPIEYDGQRFADDHNLSPDFKCDNCGGELAINVKYFSSGEFRSYIHCPNCQKKF